MRAHVASQHHSSVAPVAWLRAARSWGYEGGKRDLRFDLLRGFAVCAMVADHINGERSLLYALTGGDRFFVSAAECFVFLSGLMMGLVNGGLIRRGDTGAALAKVLRRAGILYALAVGWTLVVAALPLALGLSWAPETDGATVSQYIVGVLTLHRTIAVIDVMLLYALLVLAAEPVLLLLHYGYTRLVLAVSWSLWLGWQLWPQEADIWPIAGDEAFTVAAWQAIFMTALVIGFHRRALERAFRAVGSAWALVLAAVALGGAVALYVARLAPLTALTGRDQATLDEWFFAKNDAAPGRLVTLAIFLAFAYALTTVAWRPLVGALGWLLLPLGQNALSAYITHLFVLEALQFIRPALLGPAPGIVAVTLFQLGGIVLVWIVVRVRPALANSLERLDSAWALSPPSSPVAVAGPAAVSIDVQLAQAEARRGITMLH